MAELVAVQSGLALFRTGEVGVIIDTQNLNPYDPQPLATILSSGEWKTGDDAINTIPQACQELADVALEGIETDVSLTAAANDSRVVRVPKKVQAAVRAGLAALHGDESSTVPLMAAGTAEKLLSGTITVAQVRRIYSKFGDASSAAQSVRMIYGGDAGREWAAKVCGATESLTAALAVSGPADIQSTVDDVLSGENTEWTDPSEPHEFLAIAEGDPACSVCELGEDDPIHTLQSGADDTPADDQPSVTYFASFTPDGDMGPTFKVDHLYAQDQDGGWWIREYGEWAPTQAPDESMDIVQLDLESYNAAATQLDEPGTPYAELSISEERLFELAKPGLDFELLDAVFATAPYVPPAVRSANAAKQLRDTKGEFIEAGGVVQDSNGDRGTIVGMDKATGSVHVKIADGSVKTVPANEVTVDRNAGGAGEAAPPPAPNAPVARLNGPAKLVPDVHALIDQYVKSSAEQTPTVAAADPLIPPPDPAPANAAPSSSGPPLEGAPDGASEDPVANSPVPPLYLAEVDSQDTAAVLACLAVIPATTEGANITVYKRVSDGWQLDNDARQAIQGPTPPALVQLTPDMLTEVETQISEGGAADGGPGATEAPPVAAAGYAVLQKFAIGETGLTASQTQGARLLAPYGTPETWPGDIVARLNEFVAGKEASPRDVKNTDRLREYWTHGEGGMKIGWGRPGDYDRCVHLLSKYLGERAHGYCQLRHHDATGFYAGHAPSEQGPHSKVAALVGEVQDGEYDGQDGLTSDPDLPHPFDDAGLDDGGCGTCGRDAEHPIHVVVMALPDAGDPEDAADGGADEESEGEPPLADMASEPHGFTPGPEGLCECGNPVDHPIHTDTLNPVPEDQAHPESDYEDADYSIVHVFTPVGESASSPEDECECGRPLSDSMHKLVVTASLAHALLADAAQEVTPGQRFRIPLVVPEGVESGDGRTFAANSLSSRPMPLALMWQPEGDEGHNGSVIVGRVDHVEKTEQGLGNAYGVFDTGEWGQEALRLVRAGMLRGISADLDEFSANVLGGGEDENHVTATKLMVTKGRLMGVTLVAKPAYAECTIELIDGEGDSSVSDGEYIQDSGEARVAALIASAAPLQPPAEWFENPNLTKATHLTVDDDGRVFGHIAAWDVDHIGLPFGTRAPRSHSNYAYFRTGAVRTAEGKDIPVGQLTLTGGHAPLRATAQMAVKHYDDTASAVADLAAGEDKFGIWVAGALRPGVTPEQVRALRASSPSGDWRPIKGSLELVAVCQVNVPGFPVARAMVAGGQVTALVAAGCVAFEEPTTVLSKSDIDARIAALEAAEQRRLDAQALAIRERMTPVLQERHAALTAAAEALKNRAHPERSALLEQKDKLKARVAAGGLDVVPFEENKHPRDHKGRFREVLARLEHLLRGEPSAQPGVQHVEDAAAKEAAGDHEGAAAAAHLGADQLESAAQKATGKTKANLDTAAKDVRQAATSHQAEHGSAADAAAEVFYDSLTSEVKELLDEAVTRAEEKLDPANPEELFAKVKAFITGTNPLSLQQVYLFIKNQLKREVKPHGPKVVRGPSPGNPSGGGPSGGGVGNGPMPS